MARKTRKRNRKSKQPSTTPTSKSESLEEGACAKGAGDQNDNTDALQRTTELDQDRQAERSHDDSRESLIRGVESNTRLLERLLEQVDELRGHVTSQDINATATANGEAEPQSSLQEEVDQLQWRLSDYQERIAELEQQNNELASQLASSSVRQTVACTDSGSGDALSWEDRKQLILEQMETDSFDAESFVQNLRADTADEPLDPVAYLEQLTADLERSREELSRRDEEIGELRCLLEQQSVTRDDGVAVGAAAIAQLVDADELIQQERERLQLLQQEWEEKFRQGEIEASLERAKLSRERLELARKNAELEEQLEHARREVRQAEESGTSSRRWRAKLGLSEE